MYYLCVMFPSVAIIFAIIAYGGPTLNQQLNQHIKPYSNRVFKAYIYLYPEQLTPSAPLASQGAITPLTLSWESQWCQCVS